MTYTTVARKKSLGLFHSGLFYLLPRIFYKKASRPGGAIPPLNDPGDRCHIIGASYLRSAKKRRFIAWLRTYATRPPPPLTPPCKTTPKKTTVTQNLSY